LATEPIRYIGFAEAVALHIMLMRRLGETRFGIFDRGLVESALARPRHAAEYENADIISQAATLCFGLIKNHPWVGGNKRTATILTDRFLYTNGMDVIAEMSQIIEMVLAVEANRWAVDNVVDWYRQHTIPLLRQ
jgi:death-on-curing protein